MKKITLLILFIIIFQTLSPLLAQYDYSYIPYRKGNKWGYCDTAKKVIIKPAYDNVTDHFYILKDSNPAIKVTQVTINDKLGVIDSTGRVIIPCKYKSVTYYRGLSSIGYVDEKSYFLLNMIDGKIVEVPYKNDKPDLKEVQIMAPYYDTEKIKPGLFKVVHVKVNSEYKYERIDSMTINADTLISPDIPDSIFLIKRNKKWGLASMRRNTFLPAKYDTIIKTYYSRTYVLKEKQNWIVYKQTEAEGAFTQFKYFKLLNNSYFLTKRDLKYGVLDFDLKIKIPFEYDSLMFSRLFLNEFAGKKSKQWQIFNFQTNHAVDSNFFDTLSFTNNYNNYLIVKKKKVWWVYFPYLNTYVYPHTSPYNGYSIDAHRRLLTIYDKKKIIGYANFDGLNYWD